MSLKTHIENLVKNVFSSVNACLNAIQAEHNLPHNTLWIPCQIGAQSSDSRWKSLPPSPSRLAICAVSYRQVDQLLTFLQCLTCQTLQNFNIIILHDGQDSDTKQALNAFQNRTNIKLGIFFSDQRHNDWGHTLRQVALELTDAEFIILTNADNYYIPRMVEYAFAAIDKYNLDMVHWDMIHSHNYPGGRNLVDYSLFKTLPAARSIDIGSFIVRTSVAKSVGFSYQSYDADGKFFSDLLSTGLIRRIGYIDRVLFVHN